MSRIISRVTGGALGVLAAGLVGSVATAGAQTGVPAVSTTCGTGTITTCGYKDLITCEWEFSFGLQPAGQIWLITVSASQTDCQKTGQIPLYKDRYPVSRCQVPTTTTGSTGEPFEGETCE